MTTLTTNYPYNNIVGKNYDNNQRNIQRSKKASKKIISRNKNKCKKRI